MSGTYKKCASRKIHSDHSGKIIVYDNIKKPNHHFIDKHLILFDKKINS